MSDNGKSLSIYIQRQEIDKLKEKLRLAEVLIDKIDDKKYKQMIATYRMLTNA